MKLHIKSCIYCNRCYLRIDGEKQWHHTMVDIPAKRLEQRHEIISHTEICCLECNANIVKDLASFAGAVD